MLFNVQMNLWILHLSKSRQLLRFQSPHQSNICVPFSDIVRNAQGISHTYTEGTVKYAYFFDAAKQSPSTDFIIRMRKVIGVEVTLIYAERKLQLIEKSPTTTTIRNRSLSLSDSLLQSYSVSLFQLALGMEKKQVLCYFKNRFTNSKQQEQQLNRLHFANLCRAIGMVPHITHTKSVYIVHDMYIYKSTIER